MINIYYLIFLITYFIKRNINLLIYFGFFFNISFFKWRRFRLYFDFVENKNKILFINYLTLSFGRLI